MSYSKEERFKTVSGSDAKVWSRESGIQYDENGDEIENSGIHFDTSYDLKDPDSASEADVTDYHKQNFHDSNETDAIARELDVTSRVKEDKTIIRELNEDGTEKAYRD